MYFGSSGIAPYPFENEFRSLLSSLGLKVHELSKGLTDPDPLMGWQNFID